MNSIISVVLVVALSLETNQLAPDCEDQGGVFSVEPTNIEVQCKTSTTVEFPCQYSVQNKGHPQWIINNVTFNSSNLPKDHSFDGKVLSVRNIAVKQNNTQYQCLFEDTNRFCVHRSSVGHLIIRCKAPKVHCISHYDYETQLLKAVFIEIVQVNYRTSYTITYSNKSSDNECGSMITIPSSSCSNQTCSHLYKIPSHCVTSDAVYLAVLVSESGAYVSPKPIKIDSINKFIKISFNKLMQSIHCTFINQPKKTKKNYALKYGSAASDCDNLPILMKGEISHSNAIVLPLNVNLDDMPEICFNIIASNGTNTVSIKGTYKFAFDSGTVVPTQTARVAAIVVSAVCGIMAVLSIVLLLIMNQYMGKRLLENPRWTDYAKDGELCGTFHWKLSLKQSYLKDIDLSTTFFKLHTLTEDCLMHEFAAKNYAHYQPQNGCGYYHIKSEELNSIKNHKKLILMNEAGSIPKFAIVKSAIKLSDSTSKGWKDVYVQELGWKKKLTAGSKFLYCARSKIITHRSYWVEQDVTEECRESDLVIEKIGGYQTGWSRSQYGYFEFIERENIKPHQRIIVKKKNGDLVTGPGVRYLVGAMSNIFDKIKPPNLAEHPEWEQVFIQSRELNRKLTPGTKYLFCAMMDRIYSTIHYEVYDVQKCCKMADFGRRHIPGYKPELGYGFFEFKQAEYLMPYKAVILVDKKKCLFTGAGAQFFCTKDYTFDQIQNKKINPPNLEKTEWEYIFIQSYSEERELLPGMKFLYCEYHFHMSGQRFSFEF